jgi:hypothetical protein
MLLGVGVLSGVCEAHEAKKHSNVAATSVSEINLSHGDFTSYCLHIEQAIQGEPMSPIHNGLYHRF